MGFYETPTGFVGEGWAEMLVSAHGTQVDWNRDTYSMGKEVVYCFQCKTRLLSDQFEQNKAVQLVNRSVCLKCAKEMLSSLPPEEQEIIRKKIEQPAPSFPVAGVVDPTSRDKTPPPASMDPLRVKPATSRQIKTRRVTGRRSSAAPAVAVVGGGLLLAVVLALVMNAGSGGTSDRKPPLSSPHAARGGPSSVASPGPGSPSGPIRPGSDTPGSDDVNSRGGSKLRGPDPAREAAARDALEEAIRFARDAPGDLRSIVKKFRSARWISEGTSVHESVVKAGEPFERQLAAILDTCEREVDKTVRALLEQKRYRDLFAYLQNELSSSDELEWTSRIQSRIDKIRSDLNGEFRVLADLAITHAKAGRVAQARAVLDPMRNLGLAFIDEEITRLDAQIEMHAKSEPHPKDRAPVTPERREPTEADRKALQDAMDEAGWLASNRSYAKAEEILAEAERRLQGTPLAAELNRFREVLQRAGHIFRAICQGLARAGGENEVEVSYYEKPRARTAKGRVVHVDETVLHLREAKMGRDARVIPLELLETDFLLSAARAYLGNDDSVRRDLACLLAIEGQFERAKTDFAREAAALPESVRSIRKTLPTGKSSKLSDTPAWKDREREAEALYEKARRLQKTNPSAATEDFKRLLTEFRDTNFVDQRLKEIQEIANRGREYVFDAQAFKDVTGGWKRIPIRGKGVRLAVVMEKEVDPAKPSTDLIDIEFFALAGTTYRFFFHVGGCCETSSSLTLQGDDLNVPLGAGETRSFPVGAPAWILMPWLPGAGNHSVHSTSPMHWGWVSGVSTTYSTSGMKRLRIAPRAKGAALSHVVVSSERYLTSTPPPPNELENGQ